MRSVRNRIRLALSAAAATAGILIPLMSVVNAPAAQAASSNFCDGSFTVLGKTGGGNRFKGAPPRCTPARCPTTVASP
jgi:hypothetical protein